MRDLTRWTPAAVLAVGCLLNSALIGRRVDSTPLRAPVGTVAPALLGARGTDDTVDAEQRKVAGMSSYMLREYQPVDYPPFSVYVGYYDEQHQGKTIHSPKNCLPGAGWEPVEAGTMTIATPDGPVTVNRYRIAGNGSQALVYYWYQGRGRVAHDELRIKYELLRDATLRGRTEEALVRIVVMLSADDVAGADQIARDAVPVLVHDVNAVMPTFCRALRLVAGAASAVRRPALRLLRAGPQRPVAHSLAIPSAPPKRSPPPAGNPRSTSSAPPP